MCVYLVSFSRTRVLDRNLCRLGLSLSFSPMMMTDKPAHSFFFLTFTLKHTPTHARTHSITSFCTTHNQIHISPFVITSHKHSVPTVASNLCRQPQPQPPFQQPPLLLRPNIHYRPQRSRRRQHSSNSSICPMWATPNAIVCPVL